MTPVTPVTPVTRVNMKETKAQLQARIDEATQILRSQYSSAYCHPLADAVKKAMEILEKGKEGL